MRAGEGTRGEEAHPTLVVDALVCRVVVEKSTVPVHTADAVAAVLEAEGVENVRIQFDPAHSHACIALRTKA